MGIAHIPNPEQEFQSILRPGWWVGWSVGWWTGWWNPFDKVGQIDPREIGQVVTMHGDFLVKHGEIMAKQGELVREMGRSFAQMRAGESPGGGAARK